LATISNLRDHLRRARVQTLIVRTAERGCFTPYGELDVGWRLSPTHVVWWGRCQPESFDALIADLRRDGAEIEVEDHRR